MPVLAYFLLILFVFKINGLSTLYVTTTTFYAWMLYVVLYVLECYVFWLVCIRNGYSLFCQKYVRKHGVSGPVSLKDVGGAWRQLPDHKKKQYQWRADKVGYYLILC